MHFSMFLCTHYNMNLKYIVYFILLSYEVTAQVYSSEKEPLLLFINKDKVLSYDIDTEELDVVVSSYFWDNLVAMDFHRGNRLLYISDVLHKNLYSVNISVEPPAIKLILDEGLVTPDGLAVDWINNNLYWTDKGNC